MKKLIFISFSIIFIFLSSCIFDLKPVITGDGNVVTETREIENFLRLEVSGDLNVYITFGIEASVKVESDKNLQKVIKTEYDDGWLKIYAESNIRKASEKNIYVTIPELRNIEVSGAASVKCENLLKTDEIKVEVSSAAKIELQVEAKELTIESSSAGKAVINGNVEDFVAEVSSAGEIKAYDLISQTCIIEASSAGHASVYASKKLIAEASSGGSINYKGDPMDKKIEKSSGGNIVQK